LAGNEVARTVEYPPRRPLGHRLDWVAVRRAPRRVSARIDSASKRPEKRRAGEL